jgi:CHAT domain-containing protein
MRDSQSPHHKVDIDNSITNLTEAVLLLSQRGRDAILMLSTLASALLARFMAYRQPKDLKSSLTYLRFLRNSFHPLEAFDIPNSLLPSPLVQALACNLELGFGDVTQDMEEMAALTHELLVSNVSGGSGGKQDEAISAFALASVRTIRLCGPTQQLPERIIQVLREATTILPNDNCISFALARCLAVRFETMYAISEYEEAIAIADKLIDAHDGGSQTSTPWREVAIRLNIDLIPCRLVTYTNPEYLEDSIHRIRRLLCVSSPEYTRKILISFLSTLELQRFRYFGLTGHSVEVSPDPSLADFTHSLSSYWSQTLLDQVGVKPNHDKLQSLQRKANLERLLASIRYNKIPDVETAVERSRAWLPSMDHHGAHAFADLLFESYRHTMRLDYLDNAIDVYRDLCKVEGLERHYFMAACGLLRSLLARFDLFHRRQDIEEVMQIYPTFADDRFTEPYLRFVASCTWAQCARLNAHPSVLTAYEKAMSLMQETLVFTPTLQTQHFHLTQTLKEWGELPADYSSYHVEVGRSKEAIETLERGRAFLWSEMRGLRTCTEQLRAADKAFAEEFATINRSLESVTMAVVQSESENGTERCEEIDSIGHLVARQRRLLEERETLLSRIRSLPSFENFLKLPPFDALSSAAAHGPVIIINQSQFSSYILLLRAPTHSPSVISTPLNFHDRANRLKDELLRVRNEKGLDSKDYSRTLASVLADLYGLIGKPVIERLRELNVPERSRVWWCPTGAFCSLPLHAMGPIPSDDNDKVYFMDLYVTSYTPSLSTLIESRKHGSIPETFDKPSLLLVAQPETLDGAWKEIENIQATKTSVTTLISDMATPKTVVERLSVHQFAHFVCHGLLEPGKPFDASFELHGGNLTLLEIVRSRLPAAEFAFLSACHTAELTGGSIADEGLHLSTAMQYCGFRSVVGTMWAMADTDGADLSKHFYKSIFLDKAGKSGAPYYERSAKALQLAVTKLRKKRGITLERWVNFVHYGA